jgi:RNA polymerase sigma-70 factor (ECF subfamily)
MNLSKIPSNILILAGITIVILSTLPNPEETTYLEKNLSVETIRYADEKSLQSYYNKYRKEFGQWAANHYSVDEEEAGDIYQQSFIIFYYNIKDGKLTELTSGVKTYLFSIGKNILRQHFKSGSKFVDQLEPELNEQLIDNSILDHYEKSEKTDKVARLLETIGEPCKTVLTLFYFHDYSMEAIAQEMDYKSEQIAAKRKFICLQQLKSMIYQKS